MPETTNPVEAIFLEALEIPAEQRQAFLEERCGSDNDLLQQVTELLASHEQTGSFFVDEQPAWCLEAAKTDRTATVGQIIGPYKLLQEIGEGGMGVVYMAEQKQPVKRRVALKIIKPGMNSKQVLARFEAERQALAMMDHPNIAKVYEAGTTVSGLPFFAMELVKGRPITTFCDENKLTLKERLRLFIDVCMAVQHAHQKGIIHRDLKPSNVLVAKFDDKPVVKVIDFGVAKATNQELTERTMFTQFGQIVGTLEYMSPEQAQFNQLDIDTRSDIYSLGVLLYELLTGDPPFDRMRLRTAAFDEVMRIIREEEPPRPSNRLSTIGERAKTVSKSRGMDVSNLCRLVRGDVDLIVMKALEKDRSRRYESASGLAADLKRFLEGSPIEARPSSAAYRVRRFLRRNRSPLILSTLAMLLTVTFGGFLWQRFERNRARVLATTRDAEYAELFMREVQSLCFQGDFARARDQLDKARSLDISEATLRTLNAQIELLAGDYDKAIDLLGEIRTDEIPNQLTVDSMLCIALQRNGDEEAHFEFLPNIINRESKTFSDHLYRGYALSIFFEEQALKELELAQKLEPTSHMAMQLYGMTKANVGFNELSANDGVEKIESAIAKLESVESYFPDSGRIQSTLGIAHAYAALRFNELANSWAFEQHLRQAENYFSRVALDSDDVLESRAAFNLLTGDLEEIVSDYERSKAEGALNNHQAIGAAVACFRRGNGEKAYEILNSTQPNFRKCTGGFRVYAQLDQIKTQEQLKKVYQGLIKQDNSSLQIYSIWEWTICRLLNDEEGMKRAAQGPMTFAVKTNKVAWMEHFKFLRGDKSIDVVAASENRFDLAYAHLYLAFDALAEGRREIAKGHFQSVIDTGHFEAFGYWWAQAFLERIDDPNWLPWL